MRVTRIDGRLAQGLGCALAMLHISAAGARVQADAQALATTDLLDRIEKFQAGFDEANHLSGVLLVARGDSVLFQHAFGQTEQAAGAASQVDMPCPVASITKIFTLTATMQLVLERQLSLDDSLSRWLPEFPDAGRITVGHLLRHRAGIAHRVSTSEQEQKHHTAADVASMAAEHPLAFTPGTESSYSTAGFGVLARVIELVDKRPYHEILARRVFGPAGMKASYDLTDPTPHAHLRSFLPLEGRLVEAPQRDLSYLAGGGSTVSTATDLLRFVRTLVAAGVNGITMQNLVPDGAARWMGASNGYFSAVAVYPDEDLTLIWIGNTWGAAATALWPNLPALVHGESLAPPVVPARIADPPTESLAKLAGHYRVRPGAVAVVELAGTHLRLDDNYLVPIGPDRFWVPGQAQSVHFVRDAEGAGVALERGEGDSMRRQDRLK
jgi:CubicO group peptidase (beta-lactamase class C family)